MRGLSKAAMLFGASYVTTTLSPYLGVVATGCRICNGLSSTNKRFMVRSPHFAKDDITSLKVVLPSWYWDRLDTSSKTEKSVGNIIYTASIEYPSGTFTQIKFGGSATGIATAGGELVSDFCDINIPNGALFWVRMFGISTNNIPFAASSTIGDFNLVDTANGGAAAFGNALTDLTMTSGTITNLNPLITVTPLAIIGMTTKKSFLLVGDSRVFGANDAFDGITSDLGETARSIGAKYGYINAGAYGDTMSIANTNDAKRSALKQYCSHVIDEYGINDVSGGVTLATLQALLTTHLGKYSDKPIYRTLLTPVSTSTDNWATLANQTPHANNAMRIAFNNWLKTKPLNIIDTFDTTSAVESAYGSGKWVVNGNANFATRDGIHGSQAANLLIKNSGIINA